MGLDMAALTTTHVPDSPVDFDVPEDVGSTELHYWRKHPNLHGWMEALYRTKGGGDESFNCVSVQLKSEDVDRLEETICANRLPPTSGFFFGVSHESRKEDDLEFISKAREALNNGLTVFYTSWW